MTAEAAACIADIWRSLKGAPEALERLRLSGAGPVLPSSFKVDVAAQASLAAAALAASELLRLRSGRAAPPQRPVVRAAPRDSFRHGAPVHQVPRTAHETLGVAQKVADRRLDHRVSRDPPGNVQTLTVLASYWKKRDLDEDAMESNNFTRRSGSVMAKCT